MNETVSLVLAGVVGGVLGTIFFGGLWLTVRWGVSSRRPERLFLGSLLLRMSIALLGFYLVARGGHWERMLVSLFGFFIARFIVIRVTGPVVAHHDSAAKEATHAP